MIRILVVDDQNFIRETISSILKDELSFLIVGEAQNGYEALELIKKINVDIAIVDLEMPGIDGIELTKKLSQNFPQIKVLILSSNEDKEYINQAVNAGARGYLIKNTSTKSDIIQTIKYIAQGYFQLGPGLCEKLTINLINSELENPESYLQIKKNYQQNFSQLKEEIEYHSQQVRLQLFEELNCEIDNLKADLHQGLNNFQQQVSLQIQSGLEDFSLNQSQQSHFIPELWQKRYLQLSQSINFIESKYNLLITNLREEIKLLRYGIFLMFIVFIPILLDILFSFQ